MQVEIVKTSSVKLNPANPRVIKDDKFRQLVQSVRSFPKMLQIRPIVVNDKMEVLGGNMRLRACQEAGMKEIPIIRASELTDDEQREFIIKDNVGFGEWSWEALANEWDAEELADWGLDVPFWSEKNNISEQDLNLEEEFDPIGQASEALKVVFLFDNEEEAEKYLRSISVSPKKSGQKSIWSVDMSTLYT